MTNKLVALLLAFSILFGAVPSFNTGGALVRTAAVDPIDNMTNRYAGCFATSEITISPDESAVTLVATAKHKADDILFDNVDLVVVDDDELSLADEAPNEDEEIEYKCTFDMNDLVFEFEANLMDEDGTILQTETIQTDAIVTENGGLDACIVVDGQEYMMSDYEDKSSIDDCFLIMALPIIGIYLIVAETAEVIRSGQNYTYNKNLEKNGKGVGTNRFVYNQSDTKTQYYKAGNYRFGFTTFAGVGCEVASAYNLMVALGEGKKVRLSDTIYMFEALAIEFSVGWGYLGSNPKEINRFLEPLKKQGLIDYKKYTSRDSFKKALQSKNSCHIIMSRWNNPKTYGLHTFYVKKEDHFAFYGYNWHYDNKRSAKKKSIEEFNDGSGFIVGYVIWKQ